MSKKPKKGKITIEVHGNVVISFHQTLSQSSRCGRR